MLKILKKYLIRELNLDVSKIDYILNHFNYESSKKNEILIAHNMTCEHLYFVNSGALRVFIIKEDGQEWTRYVAFEGMFISIMPSFIKQTSSLAALQSIDDSELLHISFNNFQKILNEFPEWEKYYREMLEKTYISSIRRIEDFISMNTKQLYNNCLKHNPQIIQRLSNKMLASYLGVSQETLSRIKSPN